MFAIAAHADEREAHVREVERSGRNLPEGSYGRRNRQAIAARETRVAARLRAVEQAYRAAIERGTQRHRRRSPPGHSVLLSFRPARRSSWRPNHDRTDPPASCHAGCPRTFTSRDGCMMGEQRDRAYGKGARMLLASLAACRDVVIWAIDLRPGAELRPWAPCPGRLATTPAEAAALPADAATIVFARAQHLADHGKREWQPSSARPALVIIINEYAELAGDAPDAMSGTGTIARLGRAPAVTLVAATQRPTQKVMGQCAARDQSGESSCAIISRR